MTKITPENRAAARERLLYGVLDKGHIRLLNIAGPTRREHEIFDASDVDPAHAARQSYGQSYEHRRSGRTFEQEMKLAEHLIKKIHTTPVEMVETWWEFKLPYFVARQFVRHRSGLPLDDESMYSDPTINEMSARYVEFPPDWYIPELSRITTKSKSNKQGRTDIQHPEAKTFRRNLEDDCARSYALYKAALLYGIPEELARMHLHTNHYTTWLWKQDLHNIMGMLQLREASDAQWEAQQYALAMKDILATVIPRLMALYQRYRAPERMGEL